MLLSTFITMPSDLATSTLAISGGLVSDTSPAWLLILGVLLFTLIIAALLGVFRSHH